MDSGHNLFHDLQDRVARIKSLAQALRMAAESVEFTDISEPFAAMAIVISNHLDEFSRKLDAIERSEA